MILSDTSAAFVWCEPGEYPTQLEVSDVFRYLGVNVQMRLQMRLQMRFHMRFQMRPLPPVVFNYGSPDATNLCMRLSRSPMYSCAICR